MLRPGCWVVSALLFLSPGVAGAGPDKEGVYILTQPERTLEEIEKAYASMPPIQYVPPRDRWKALPRTVRILHERAGTLRVVMLGDSIVNDTSRSRWDDLVQQAYPHCKITKITVVRGGTGCWWYKEAGRVQRYVLPYRPDLLILGGISHREDTDSIRDVIRQVRAAQPCDVLLLSGAFGPVDPRDAKQWSLVIAPEGNAYRARLQRLAAEEQGAFLDLTVSWGRYLRSSGKDLNWFKRDPIHANVRGEQILGRILAAYLAPDPPERR